MSKNDKITLYLLEDSRAHRVLWLLEELKLEYILKIYKSDTEERADPELFQYHKLGKSPILGINNDYFAESGFIVSYLIEHYDFEKKFEIAKPIDTKINKDQNMVNYLVQYSEGTIMPHITQIIVFDIARKKAPYIKRALCNTVCSAIEDGYAKPEIVLNLDFLEGLIIDNNKFKSNKDEWFFVGPHISGADIMLIWPLEFLVNGKGKIYNKDKWPNVLKWLESIKKREAFKIADSKYSNRYY